MGTILITTHFYCQAYHLYRLVKIISHLVPSVGKQEDIPQHLPAATLNEILCMLMEIFLYIHRIQSYTKLYWDTQIKNTNHFEYFIKIYQSQRKPRKRM